MHTTVNWPADANPLGPLCPFTHLCWNGRTVTGRTCMGGDGSWPWLYDVIIISWQNKKFCFFVSTFFALFFQNKLGRKHVLILFFTITGEYHQHDVIAIILLGRLKPILQKKKEHFLKTIKSYKKLFSKKVFQHFLFSVCFRFLPMIFCTLRNGLGFDFLDNALSKSGTITEHLVILPTNTVLSRGVRPL